MNTKLICNDCERLIELSNQDIKDINKGEIIGGTCPNCGEGFSADEDSSLITHNVIKLDSLPIEIQEQLELSIQVIEINGHDLSRGIKL